VPRSFARAKYFVHGEIESDWRITNETYKISVTVPPGTVATVFVSGNGPIRTQSRRPADIKANINRSFEVAAGAHSFETALQRTQNWRNSLQVTAIVAAGNQCPKSLLTIGECEMGSGAQAAQVGPGFST